MNDSGLSVPGRKISAFERSSLKSTKALILLYGVQAGTDLEDSYAFLPQLAPRLSGGGDAAVLVAVAACGGSFLCLLGGVGSGCVVLLLCIVVACDQGQHADHGDEYFLHYPVVIRD